jgi:hypothetical protein
MRSIYSNGFRPHFKHVIELLQLISGQYDAQYQRYDSHYKLKQRVRLNPNQLTDYLAYASLTGSIETNSSLKEEIPKGRSLSTGEFNRLFRYTYTVSTRGHKLLEANNNWEAALELPSPRFEQQITKARLDLEAACNSVREYPDLVNDKTPPEDFSISTLHPEF